MSTNEPCNCEQSLKLQADLSRLMEALANYFDTSKTKEFYNIYRLLAVYNKIKQEKV